MEPMLRNQVWHGDPRTLIQALDHQPRMVQQISLTTSPSIVYILEVGKASVDRPQLAAFTAYLMQQLQPKLEDMYPPCIMGQGTAAVWHVQLAEQGRHFAELSRSFCHSGFFSVNWNSQVVSLPSRLASASLPAGTRQLTLLNIPPSISKVGLPEAILQLAGYHVVQGSASNSGLAATPGNTVAVLQYRLGNIRGGGQNGAVFVVDVLPPPGDPYLLRLPPSLTMLDNEVGPKILTLVRDDPYPHVTIPRITGQARGMPEEIQRPLCA